MVNPNRSKLSGTVEIDETYVGGEAIGKHGRGAENKVLVAVAVEINGKKLGRCRMSIIADASSNSLHPFITENVERGSTLVTDGWSGYSGIEKHGFTKEIHIQKRGTVSQPFRMDCIGSDKRYSFHMTYSQSERLCIFESPIDAMSHASFTGEWRRDNRLSLAGTSDTALPNYLEAHPHVREL